MTAPIWQPSRDRIERANITRFARKASEQTDRDLGEYSALHRWSIEQPEAFWSLIWDQCGVIADSKGTTVLRNAGKMPGAQWFPQAKLNYAENLLRRRNDDIAIVFWNECGTRQYWTCSKLYDEVSRLEQALAKRGVGKGDVVAGWLPNIPQTIAVALAAASRGALWSSCSPDFGVQGVLDRFSQLKPKLLFAANRYSYGGKTFDCSERLQDVAHRLPSLTETVVVAYLNETIPPGFTDYRSFVDQESARDIPFEPLPFDHPLYVLFSSGTTGKPKGIVHGAGGTLLQHLKEHQLHCDAKAGDRLFYYTTCGWMMWNWLITALASEATLLLYDGSPMHPTPDILFDYAQEEHMNIFGTSAKYIEALRKQKLTPSEDHDLAALTSMLSTGSPLAPELYDYVYNHVKQDLCLSSISGGTDIVSCFVLGNPTLPVYRGEIQSKGLGMDVAIFNDAGERILKQQGELVCCQPFPSMPVGFWNDPDGQRYRAAYFERFKNIWHHGDFAEQTEHDGFVLYGRSDATLNPGGVRIGTAEIYRQVEKLDDVLESVAIGQEYQGDIRIVLFVKLRDSMRLGDNLIKQIKQVVRDNATPRHVPAIVAQVDAIPRTKSGKISELAVRAVVHGQSVHNTHALANPEALEQFKNRDELVV